MKYYKTVEQAEAALPEAKKVFGDAVILKVETEFKSPFRSAYDIVIACYSPRGNFNTYY